MDESGLRLRLMQLREEVKEASQAPLAGDIDRVGWTFQAYVANARHFLKHIQDPHPNFEIAMQTRVPGDRPEIYRRYQAELYRLLMNYSASTSALVDHTRILEQKLEKTNQVVYAELINRRRNITESGLSHFIKNLRNFVLHCDLPSTSGAVSFRQGDDRFRFDTEFSSASLLEWGGWSKLSKEYLLEHENISMSEAIVQYDKLIQELYAWIFKDVSQAVFENAQRKVSLGIAVTNLEYRLEHLNPEES